MSVLANAARTLYDLAFQISPIILTGGSVASVPGGALPIIMLTGQLASFVQGALTGGGLSTDDFFARFLVVPGGNLVNNAIGMYPFANQQVAANAIIQQPLSISLVMECPVRDDMGYLTKTAILTSLATSLKNHNTSGGLYTIATPAYLYTNCIMTSMTDVTGGATKQQQVRWQFDFVQPIVTVQGAQATMNGLMSKVSNGSQVTDSSWSGDNATVNNSSGAGGNAGPVDLGTISPAGR
jgi:hypothetical protein